MKVCEVCVRLLVLPYIYISFVHYMNQAFFVLAHASDWTVSPALQQTRHFYTCSFLAEKKETRKYTIGRITCMNKRSSVHISSSTPLIFFESDDILLFISLIFSSIIRIFCSSSWRSVCNLSASSSRRNWYSFLKSFRICCSACWVCLWIKKLIEIG